MKYWMITAVILGGLLTGQGWAFDETSNQYEAEHNEYTLDLKGYSPELIQPLEAQVARLEGRYPPAVPSKKQFILINLLNNEPLNALEPFGSDKVDAPKYPVRY
jgi:hypothetical protein